MTWTHERATVASLSRHRSPDDPAVIAARERLRAARFEEHVRRLVDSAPKLTDEQRARLAALLRPDVGTAA